MGYLHSWEPSPADGGDFIWYNNQSSWQGVLPSPRSGSVVDGSKMLHASTIYRPDVKAPKMEKNNHNVLKWVGGENWEVQSDGRTMQKYQTNDLRVTIVYRAKCFKDATELEEYKDYDSKNVMDLDTALGKLQDDMVSKKAIRREDIDKISRLDMAFKIIETYIRYPLPPLEIARIPYNYCALGVIAPFLEPVLRLVCK